MNKRRLEDQFRQRTRNQPYSAESDINARLFPDMNSSPRRTNYAAINPESPNIQHMQQFSRFSESPQIERRHSPATNSRLPFFESDPPSNTNDYSQNSSQASSRQSTPRSVTPKKKYPVPPVNESKMPTKQKIFTTVLFFAGIITTIFSVLSHPSTYCIDGLPFNGCKRCPQHATCSLKSFQCERFYVPIDNHCVNASLSEAATCVREKFKFDENYLTSELSFNAAAFNCGNVKEVINTFSDMYEDENYLTDAKIVMVRSYPPVNILLYLAIVIWICLIVTVAFGDKLFPDL